MKIKFIFAAVFAACLVFFAGCSDIASDAGKETQNIVEKQKGTVHFVVEGFGENSAEAKTVLPVCSINDLTNIVVSYTTSSYGSYTTYATYNDYAALTKASISLDPGTYYFKITASSNGNTLSGTSSATTISASSNASVSITLSSDYGAVKINFTNYNAIGATKFKVKLGSSTYTDTAFSTKNYFYITDASVGSKLLTATFYNNNGDQVGIYTTYVQVLGGALSEETVDLSNLAANILMYKKGIEIDNSDYEIGSFTLSEEKNVKVSMLNPSSALYCYLVNETTYKENSWKTTSAPSGTIAYSGKTENDWSITKKLPAGKYYVVVYNNYFSLAPGNKTVTIRAEVVE